MAQKSTVPGHEGRDGIRLGRFHAVTVALCAGLALLLRFVIGYESIVPVALALGVVAFYRSLGNPLASDTKMEYFRAIPESPWKKIFFSLLGGSASCLLDLVPLGVLILFFCIVWD